MKGVLHNFLGTLTSRYSDHRGYWLFGPLSANSSGSARISCVIPLTAMR